MDRRDNLGHMDFEWENAAVDKSSPFVQLGQKKEAQPNHAKPTLPNTFSAAAKQSSPLRMQSFNAPSRSIFSPSLAKQNSAPSFRPTTFTNSAFSTPRDSRFTEMDIDDSPAPTDASGVADTPDMDRSDLMDDFSISSPEPKRILWPDKRSGKGGFPRATGHGLPHDRVRKRPRVDKDKDIGSTRSRLPGGCDEDDSDYEAFDDDNGKRRRLKSDMGWLHYILSTISANPDAPIIFSYWLQLFIDGFLGLLLLSVAGGAYFSARDEILYSAEKARQDKEAEIQFCSREFTANRCAPIANRMPALEALCNEWDKCMNQDQNSVAGVKASVGHLADIINEFTTRLSWKSIFVILMVVLVILVANTVAFSKFRQNVRHYNYQRPADPAPSHPAMGFPMSPERSNQAYIFAPIGQTPKHIRRALFQDDTDTDASPDPRLLLPPRTPSRRSPSKSERGRSPSKRSPSKGY